MNKRSKLYKYIVCSRCGQIGQPLVNRGDHKNPEYICKWKDLCDRRANIATAKGTLCSHWYCGEPAKVKCSCGLILCNFHKNLAEHFGHSKEKL